MIAPRPAPGTADGSEPVFDDDDLAPTRKVPAPMPEADGMRTAVECPFGAAAAGTPGVTPRGLSDAAILRGGRAAGHTESSWRVAFAGAGRPDSRRADSPRQRSVIKMIRYHTESA